MLEHVKNPPARRSSGRTIPGQRAYPTRMECARFRTLCSILLRSWNRLLEEPRLSVSCATAPPGPHPSSAGHWRTEDAAARAHQEAVHPHRLTPGGRGAAATTRIRTSRRRFEAGGRSCGGRRRARPRGTDHSAASMTAAAHGKLEILGLPHVGVTVAAKLNASQLVRAISTSRPTARDAGGGAAMNGTHRDSAQPKALVPARRRARLECISLRVFRRHRIRLA